LKKFLFFWDFGRGYLREWPIRLSSLVARISYVERTEDRVTTDFRIVSRQGAEK
jgi:hypothetical protein